MTEQEIQKAIVDYLKGNGFFVWRNQTQGVTVGGKRRVKNPNAGSPDLMAIKEGAFYCIEVKKPGGKVGTHQIDWLSKARTYGAKCLIARSVKDVVEFLEGKPPVDDESTPLFPNGAKDGEIH